jgi:hypothetical protein
VLRELNNPAARLLQAVHRYTDGLHVAAEQLIGPQTVAELDQADQHLPGLTTEPAWPTLRAHLLALAAETGQQHPLRHMLAAASERDLRTAADMAAVPYWRLPELAPVDPGPLPWLPGIRQRSTTIPSGGLPGQAIPLVADLANQIQDHACQADAQPIWAVPGSQLSTTLIGGIAVWQAANSIHPQDPRPTGVNQLETLPARWKQRLDRDIAGATNPPADARPDERQAAHTAPRRWHDGRQRPYQQPGRRPSGPSAPGR